MQSAQGIIPFPRSYIETLKIKKGFIFLFETLTNELKQEKRCSRYYHKHLGICTCYQLFNTT